MSDQMFLDYLRGPSLTALAASEAVKSGLPQVLPQALFNVSTAKPAGMEVEWDEVTGNRQTALIVDSMGPSRAVTMEGVTRRTTTAMGSKENFGLNAEMLLALKSDLPVARQRAENFIVRNLANFRARFDNLKISMVASAFAKGAIYVGSNGQLLYSSTGAVRSVTYNTRTTFTKSEANKFVTGDWSSAGADIVGAIGGMKSYCAQTNGYALRNVLYGSAIPGYLVSNTAIKEYLAINTGYNQTLMSTGEIPNGFMGLNWTPVRDAVHVAIDGTVTPWFGAKSITAFPDVSPEWYEMYEAGSLIPNGVAQPGMSLDQLVALCSVVNGYFSYAEMSTDPMLARIISGWYGLPVIKVPGVVFSGTVA